MVDIAALAKEMATKYHEDELGWCIGLKRLERQGYEIIKKETFYDEIKLNESFVIQSKKLAEDSLNILKTVLSNGNNFLLKKYPEHISFIVTNENMSCSKCNKIIKPDNQNRIIQYKNSCYCHNCILKEVSNWEREKYDIRRNY